MSTVDPEARLDVAECEAIASFVAHYPSPRAACVEALKHVQRNRLYIAAPVLAEIAPLLGMSVTELDEVATFYNLIFRRPVGDKIILLCDSITCWMLGGDKIAGEIRKVLEINAGETTADGRYTWLPTVCLGHCDHAPAMMIGDALFGGVKAENLSAMFKSV
jgi:NADH-quinone oxidoreductase subunit E